LLQLSEGTFTSVLKDLGGPKTYRSYRSGSGTLLESVQIERQDKKEGRGGLGKWTEREDLKGRTERIIKRAQSTVKKGREVNKKWARGRGLKCGEDGATRE
jgi:hypothetical protein